MPRSLPHRIGNYLMKKMITALLVSLAAFAASAAAPSLITIKGSKKTADSHHNSSAAGRKTVTHTSKDVFYEFELTTSSPAAPDNVIVKWVVVTVDPKARMRLGTVGQKEIALTRNKPAAIETEDITIESKSVSGHHGHQSSQSEEKVLGYGVRVFDGNGRIIAEEFNPKNEEKTFVAAFDGKLKDEAN
jgi:hypothetical protein